MILAGIQVCLITHFWFKILLTNRAHVKNYKLNYPNMYQHGLKIFLINTTHAKLQAQLSVQRQH